MSPEKESESTLAPELAKLSAEPMAAASPVSPEAPEAPVMLPPPMAMAVPSRPVAVLVAVGRGRASPESPVSPVSPDSEDGLAVAPEVAAPVSPVLVALDWEVDAPEPPLVVVGVTVPVAPPPAPPLAWPVATLLPPAGARAEAEAERGGWAW